MMFYIDFNEQKPANGQKVLVIKPGWEYYPFIAYYEANLNQFRPPNAESVKAKDCKWCPIPDPNLIVDLEKVNLCKEALFSYINDSEKDHYEEWLQDELGIEFTEEEFEKTKVSKINEGDHVYLHSSVIEDFLDLILEPYKTE